MAGVSAEFDLEGMAEVNRRFAGLTVLQVDDLAFDIGAILESSTQRRIADDKTSPEGEPWVPWSETYDNNRAARHSLLVGEGDLRDSIQNLTTGNTVRVGTPLVYGAVHQFGSADDGNIPARPYLGLSSDDKRDIRDLVIGDLEEALL